MRGTVAKRLRRTARKISHNGVDFKKTYKHLKSTYRHTGSSDIIGDAERQAKAEKEALKAAMEPDGKED